MDLRVTCIPSVHTFRSKRRCLPVANGQPPSYRCRSCAGPVLGLAPCEPLCAPAAHRDGRRRERGVANGEAAQPLWRAHHVRVLRLKLDIRSGGACALAFARWGGGSTQSTGSKTIITIVHLSVKLFLLSRGWRGHVQTTIDYHPPLAATRSSTSIPTPATEDPYGSGSASTASASASPKSPSSTNGTLSALTICAVSVVSAPGATCPLLPGIVDGTCAACCGGGSEENGIF